MLKNLQNVKALLSNGFTMADLAIFRDDEIAATSLEYLKSGMKKEDVVEYVKADASAQMSTKKSQKTVDPTNPENVLETSAGVLEKTVNFGGITGAGFVEWNGVPCLRNDGTGRKINSLFLPLSKKLKEGKIDIREARALIHEAIATMNEHVTVLETADAFFKAEGDKKGIESEPAKEAA